MKLFLSGHGLSALVLVLTLIGQSAFAAVYETGEPVDFSLPQLDGEGLALSDFRGQWVILNYWATWCAPCRKEIPELSELHDDRQDITVLGIAYEDVDKEMFEEFLQEFHVSYPILVADVYQPPEPFGAPRVLPTTIILDPAGRSVKAFLGPVTRQDIEAFVDAQPVRLAKPEVTTD
ncbi:MAG TPA: TlpA disulfide reductase family protein [Xanthomonadales bacterium]|nr:TlpA disulfide reductase family protein [Xanthomonadales bacterium]